MFLDRWIIQPLALQPLEDYGLKSRLCAKSHISRIIEPLTRLHSHVSMAFVLASVRTSHSSSFVMMSFVMPSCKHFGSYVTGRGRKEEIYRLPSSPHHQIFIPISHLSTYLQLTRNQFKHKQTLRLSVLQQHQSKWTRLSRQCHRFFTRMESTIPQCMRYNLPCFSSNS